MGASEEGFVRVSPINRWLLYLVLVPGIIILAALGMFIFAVFLGLFAIAAAVFWLRLWWIRRKLEGPAAAAVVENEYQEIEVAEIIEIKTNRMGRD
ncbi:MAG: hypothetical protein JW384_01447 [Nitrosomonadaceae bacterium]|nr:hypothetical protein [Nitrosospira sp.]MBI0413600.1 hypothetical protein [Nitrosospira sp.]MCG3770301.1 hypothetical protein [Nitrosomonadaceae bacterium]GDX60108.1 hypothetical protein LBMAG31_09840 [Nitrosomonadaceae bacterium]